MIVKGQVLDSMAIVFTEPAGARANADYIVKLVSKGVWMTVEIFNDKGERKVVSSADLGKSVFNPAGTDNGLAAAIRAFADRSRRP